MVTIETPAPINSNPIAIVQRRSRPVKGSALVLFVGVALVVVGAVSFVGGAVVDVGFSAGVVFSGVLFSFDGDVPVVGVGAGAGVLDVGGGVVEVFGGGAVWL